MTISRDFAHPASAPMPTPAPVPIPSPDLGPAPASAPGHHHGHPTPKPLFPPHNAPRIWFIAGIGSPIALSLARTLLAHGDYVVGTATAGELDEPRRSHFDAFLNELRDPGTESTVTPTTGAGPKQAVHRFKLVSLDRRIISECQSGLASAVAAFGRIDIVVCFADDILIGSVEETASTDPSLSRWRNTFEQNLFGNINLIKSVLPVMRRQNTGHIIVVTATSGHVAVPGLTASTASQWALEGFCDSLAYECAPFNVRVTIVQPPFETRVLTSRLTAAPEMADYTSGDNSDDSSAGRVRNTMNSLVGRFWTAHAATSTSTQPGRPHSIAAVSKAHTSRVPDSVPSYAPLAPSFASSLVAETVFAIAAIGGHDNPPLHHIVGNDGIAEAREKERMIRVEIDLVAGIGGDG